MSTERAVRGAERRQRLKLLREQFAPPSGYAVFPEELDRMAPPAPAASDDSDCPF